MRTLILGTFVLGICAVGMTTSVARGAEPAEEGGSAYAPFNTFAAECFGAEKEPLVYQAFGDNLEIIESSRWIYPSETSATIAFQTNLPADAYIEYGTTAEYGSQTGTAERPFYTHVRYLTDLQPKTTYHYRLVARDERGNIVRSPDQTFTTGLPAEARKVVRIPDDMQGPPYVLDQPNTYYLVTRDLTVDGLALDVPTRVDNVTIDLGGRTITYNEKAWPQIASGNFHDWIKEAQYGLRIFKANGTKVFNGTIRQGAGRNAAQANSIGYNPIYANGVRDMEVGGVTIEYSGPQQIGIYMHWGGDNARFHHNVFVDDGTGIINRHGAGSKSLLVSAQNVQVDHNLVKRTRQSALQGNRVLNNEIYVDSWATNSFGVGLASEGLAEGNRVLGTGYHVVAFGWGRGQTFRNNFVHLEGTPVKGRFSEYGDQISLNGFRLTQYDGATKDLSGNTYYDNIVVIGGRKGAQGRGSQFWGDPNVKGLVYRNNTIKAVSHDETSPHVAAVVTHGSWRNAELQEPIIYQDDQLISNVCNVRFGDDYGVGSNSRFINCTFIRIGDDPRYRTFSFDRAAPSQFHVVRDPVFEGGASMDSIAFTSDRQDVTFEWTITLKTVPGADVKITDRAGKEVFAGTADEAGQVVVPLAQHTRKRDETITHTPHTVTLTHDGQTTTGQVVADARKTVEMPIR